MWSSSIRIRARSKCACQLRVIAAGQKDYTACYCRVLGFVAIVYVEGREFGPIGVWGWAEFSLVGFFAFGTSFL